MDRVMFSDFNQYIIWSDLKYQDINLALTPVSQGLVNFLLVSRDNRIIIE